MNRQVPLNTSAPALRSGAVGSLESAVTGDGFLLVRNHHHEAFQLPWQRFPCELPNW